MYRLWHRDRTGSALQHSHKFRSILDLGTSSVKTLVVELRDKQTHVWGHGEAALEGGYGPDGEIVDREAVAAACNAALSAAEEMTLDTFGHKIVPDQSVWGVPAWLCQDQTTAFQQRRSHPARRISEKEWRALQTRLNRAVASLGNVPVDVIPTAQVDDNTVTDVLGLRGGTLTLRALIVTVRPGPLATLRAIATDLELDLPTFVSQARATTAGLGRDGLLLDVGRWGTGIAVARHGHLVGSAWVPMGGQSLYRTLSNDFRLTPSQLPGFCQAYAEGWLPPQTKAAADAALVDSVTRWLEMVVGQLSALAVEMALPHQIFLAGGASRLPAVLQGARQYDWMRHASWARHPEVRVWQAAAVGGLTDRTNQHWGASDLARLGLAQLAIHIE